MNNTYQMKYVCRIYTLFIIFPGRSTEFYSYVALNKKNWIFNNKNQSKKLLGSRLGYFECKKS